MKIQSDEVLSKFENILMIEKNQNIKRKLESISAQELNRRIDIAMEDSKNGRLTEANDLLAEIEKWS